MQFVAPDILTDVRQLSDPLIVGGLVIGLLLWLTGWWGHRFWVVLFTTTIAGIAGLQAGRIFEIQPLVVGLLLAVAAGLLALALVRVMAFVAGGLSVLLAVHYLAPHWDQPVICFLVGGLVSLILVRWWTMTLTSLLGTLLMLYAGLTLADHLGRIDAVSWADSHAVMLNWCCLGGVVLGLMVQFVLNRWWSSLVKRRRERAMDALSEEEREHIRKLREQKKSWWNLGRMKSSQAA